LHCKNAMHRIPNMPLTPTVCLAILAAVLAHYAIGSIWFVALKEPYLESLGKTAKQMKKGPTILQASILHLLCGLVTAFVLQWVIMSMQAHGIFEGMQVAAVMWLGFVACIIGPMYAYQAFSLKFFLINGTYQLLGLLAMGGIIGLVC